MEPSECPFDSTFVKHGYLLQSSSSARKNILFCGDVAKQNPGNHRSSRVYLPFLQSARSLKAVVADGGLHESELSILPDINNNGLISVHSWYGSPPDIRIK